VLFNDFLAKPKVLKKRCLMFTRRKMAHGVAPQGVAYLFWEFSYAQASVHVWAARCVRCGDERLWRGATWGKTCHASGITRACASRIEVNGGRWPGR
jgi:hypothetical protein